MDVNLDGEVDPPLPSAPSRRAPLILGGPSPEGLPQTALSYAAWGSSRLAAAMFSSRCLTDEVPGIGSITLDLLSNHARATCRGLASRFLSDLLYGVVRLFSLAEWSPRKKRNAVMLARSQQRSRTRGRQSCNGFGLKR